jgi:hypothetical protein
MVPPFARAVQAGDDLQVALQGDLDSTQQSLRCRVTHQADDRCDLLCLDLEKAERPRLDRLDPASARLLAERARALSDPTRLTLAAALGATDELCVCDLAWVSEGPRT